MTDAERLCDLADPARQVAELCDGQREHADCPGDGPCCVAAVLARAAALLEREDASVGAEPLSVVSGGGGEGIGYARLDDDPAGTETHGLTEQEARRALAMRLLATVRVLLERT